MFDVKVNNFENKGENTLEQTFWKNFTHLLLTA